VAGEGIARLEVALPVLADGGSSEEGGDEPSDRGCDPHKKSVTIEAVDERGQVLASGRLDTTGTG